MQQQEYTENASVHKLRPLQATMSTKKELEIKGKDKRWGNPHLTQECQLTTRLEQDISVNTQTKHIPIPPSSKLLQEHSNAIPRLEVCPNENVLT